MAKLNKKQKEKVNAFLADKNIPLAFTKLLEEHGLKGFNVISFNLEAVTDDTSLGFAPSCEHGFSMRQRCHGTVCKWVCNHPN